VSKIGSVLICEYCSEEYACTSNRQKYCSQTCVYRNEYNSNRLDYKWRLAKLVSMAKGRAKVKSVPFNLTKQYIISLWDINKGCCLLTEQPFDLQKQDIKGQVSPEAPSIDRIIPSLGYVEGNVRLITYHMNVALADFGTGGFEKLIKAYTNGS